MNLEKAKLDMLREPQVPDEQLVLEMVPTMIGVRCWQGHLVRLLSPG